MGDAALSQGGTTEAGGADSLNGGSGDDYLDESTVGSGMTIDLLSLGEAVQKPLVGSKR